VVTIDRNLFGTRLATSLPTLEYQPGLVSLRRCDDCGDIDRRTWYASPERALEKLASWTCPGCASGRGTIVRGWFDTVYGE
jgi:hypothetical protein